MVSSTPVAQYAGIRGTQDQRGHDFRVLTGRAGQLELVVVQQYREYDLDLKNGESVIYTFVLAAAKWYEGKRVLWRWPIRLEGFGICEAALQSMGDIGAQSSSKCPPSSADLAPLTQGIGLLD